MFWVQPQFLLFQGYRYYLLVLDDFTKYTWVVHLRYKSEVKQVVTDFGVFVSTQFNQTIKIFRSDNGGEFVNKYLSHLYLQFGILHQTSCPNTPEQNGSAERKHRHLVKTTITLVHQASLPTQFWLEALTIPHQ